MTVPVPVPDFTAPQIAIGTLDVFHDTQNILVIDMPGLDTRSRTLLPGAKEYRYWQVDVSLDGGQKQTLHCRLKVSHLHPSPGDSIPLDAGNLVCWVKVVSADETEIVPAGVLSVGRR